MNKGRIFLGTTFFCYYIIGKFKAPS